MDDKLKLLFIFLIAFVARFYLLVDHPVSLSMDEVNIANNAYSILKTGRDEHGEVMPLAFRSVGDYKPPVNIYLTSGSIALFGLTEFAVRFPTAFIGSLTAVGIALLLRELKFKKIAWVASGLWAAALPWHIHFSRGGFEAVTAVFFVVLGTWLFLRAINTKSSKALLLCIIAFCVSVWAYHSARFFVPLLFVFLVWNWRDTLKVFALKSKGWVVGTTVVLLVFLVPFLHLTLFTPAVTTRALSTSILREFGFANTLHNGVYASLGEFVLDNDIYKIVHHFAGKYLNYFDLEFWFWDGMQFTRPGQPDVGLFYVVDIIFILGGLFFTFTLRNKKVRNLGIFWFLTGPIPAAFTMNEQHPLRALVWLPFFTLAFASFWHRVKVKKFVIVIYVTLVLGNFVYFSDVYFRQFPRAHAESWQYGYEQAVRYACENRSKYKAVYISDTFGSLGPLNTGTPYAYALFYCGVEPSEYLETKNIHNLEFTRLTWENDGSLMEGSLIIAAPWDFPSRDELGQRLVGTIYYPNGVEAFLLVEP